MDNFVNPIEIMGSIDYHIFLNIVSFLLVILFSMETSTPLTILSIRLYIYVHVSLVESLRYTKGKDLAVRALIVQYKKLSFANFGI